MHYLKYFLGKKAGWYFHYKECIDRNLGKYDLIKEEFSQIKRKYIIRIRTFAIKINRNLKYVNGNIEEHIFINDFEINSNFLT